MKKMICKLSGWFSSFKSFLKTGDKTPIGGCISKAVEVHQNVTVIVSKCKNCGEIHLRWTKDRVPKHCEHLCEKNDIGAYGNNSPS